MHLAGVGIVRLVRARVACSALIGMAVLAGCSEEPVAEPLPPITSAPSSTKAPEPSLPPEAQGEGVKAAEAFATYYFELVSTAFQTADASAVRAVSDPGCEGCDLVIDLVERIQRDRQTVQGGTFTVLSAVAPGDSPTDVLVDLEVTQEAQILVDEQGQVVQEEPASGKADAQMRVVYQDGGWVVYGYRFSGEPAP